MVGRNHNSDETTETRQLRKTRGLQSRRQRTIEFRSDDLPVFLVNPDRTFRTRDPQFSFDSPNEERPSRPVDQFTNALKTYYLATKAWLASFSQPSQESGFHWRGAPSNEHVARFGLIALLVPLLFLVMPRDTPHPGRRVPTKVAAPVAPPEFHLEERLAFAQGLRDRLVLSAIEADFDRSKAPEVETRAVEPPQAHTETQTGDEGPSDAAAATASTIVMDDRRWSLPFDSQEYRSAPLPQTPADSFLAAIPVSPSVNEAANVAQSEAPVDEPTPTAKPKAEKRRKVVAQRKRPAPANQVTASAAPVVIQQAQPNLPPPPILFFLGAPPPASPPSAAQKPQASTAPAFQPSSPPQNSSWLPDSIYDNVKNRY